MWMFPILMLYGMPMSNGVSTYSIPIPDVPKKELHNI